MPPLVGAVSACKCALIEPRATQRADTGGRRHDACTDGHQRTGLMRHQRRSVQLQDDALPNPGRRRLDRVLPRSGSGTDGYGAAAAHEDLDTAAFVDAACGAVDVVESDLDACHHPMQAPQRAAKPVRGALLPQLTFKVVGAEVKLHDQTLEKLRQLHFVAKTGSKKADSR